MAESVFEQALQALQARLAAIASDGGTTRWYTPGHVIRFPALTSECLNTPDDVVYVISPDDEPINGGQETLTQDESRPAIDITLCKRFAPTSENPFDPPADGDRILMQNRLVQDCLAALDVERRPGGGQLGGTCSWIYFRHVTRKPEATYFQGWALAFVRIELDLFYPSGTP